MTGTGTNTYVVDDEAGSVAVIDPGPDEPGHLRAILSAVGDRGHLVAILVTHRHLDHLPAARPLADRTGAPLYGHRDLPGRDRVVADGEVCFAGLRGLETPGHTDDSLCFWDSEQRALFTGDLVAGAGTVIVDEQPGALARYMASLERLRALGPSTIHPGHGPIVADGQAKLDEYLAHRRQREQQVIDVLRQRGRASVEELVASIYPDVQSALLPMAARNVRAHLHKLADEGRAVDGSGGWVLTPASPNG
jgi:glyoxylase-like metal-dependent hydrolase (beta-lactamase superfamily II)